MVMLKSLQAQNANMVMQEFRFVIRADLLSSGVEIFVVGFSEFTVVKNATLVEVKLFFLLFFLKYFVSQII